MPRGTACTQPDNRWYDTAGIRSRTRASWCPRGQSGPAAAADPNRNEKRRPATCDWPHGQWRLDHCQVGNTTQRTHQQTGWQGDRDQDRRWRRSLRHAAASYGVGACIGNTPASPARTRRIQNTPGERSPGVLGREPADARPIRRTTADIKPLTSIDLHVHAQRNRAGSTPPG